MMMNNTANLLELAQQASEHLLSRQMKVCTAESCTGGYLAQTLTALPGSSAWFDCGWVTYSNFSKQKLLNVPEALITTHGAVSEVVVGSMAKGALMYSQADLAIAITGIAGPTGGTPDKPVGTVWLAWQLREYDPITRCAQFKGDRDWVRNQAVAMALQMILNLPPY